VYLEEEKSQFAIKIFKVTGFFNYEFAWVSAAEKGRCRSVPEFLYKHQSLFACIQYGNAHPAKRNSKW
jgi:hypothetical protein